MNIFLVFENHLEAEFFGAFSSLEKAERFKEMLKEDHGYSDAWIEDIVVDDGWIGRYGYASKYEKQRLVKL